MRKLLLLCLSLIFMTGLQAQVKSIAQINKLMDSWHQAAANADFKAYFDLMDEASIFIGTDATERWDKPAFMAYAKPHFDRGKAWSFQAIERHINFSADGKTAWIDELLNTQMKICRGSAVLVRNGNQWLIKHYVLSMTIPNDLVDHVVPLKADMEQKIIDSLQSNIK